MTLIAGVRGIKKCYIAADSRATITYPDGTSLIRDDAKKWINHGEFALTAVAGDAKMGAFITKKVLDDVGKNPYYLDVKSAFDNNLEEYVKAFTRTTGRYAHCAIILAGFNPNELDEFDAGRIGEVMAAGVKKMGEGVTVNQNIDREILKAMQYAMTKAEIFGKRLGVGQLVKVGTPRSEVTGYKVTTADTGVIVETEQAGNFEALFYGADAAYNKIELPPDVIAEIYFREINNQSAEAIVKADTMQLFIFFQKIIKERGYKNVGGGIFPSLVTTEGSFFYAGAINRLDLKTQMTEVVRDTGVENGRLSYRDPTGQLVPYESLLDIAKTLPADYQISA